MNQRSWCSQIDRRHPLPNEFDARPGKQAETSAEILQIIPDPPLCNEAREQPFAHGAMSQDQARS
jgi:hypothetical protein